MYGHVGMAFALALRLSREAAQTPVKPFKESAADEKELFEIRLRKGQTMDTLKAAFQKVGFDPERPRVEIELAKDNVLRYGYSYLTDATNGKAEAYMFPREANALAAEGFDVRFAPVQPVKGYDWLRGPGADL